MSVCSVTTTVYVGVCLSGKHLNIQDQTINTVTLITLYEYYKMIMRELRTIRYVNARKTSWHVVL